jgi:hypothetical protein
LRAGPGNLAWTAMHGPRAEPLRLARLAAGSGSGTPSTTASCTRSRFTPRRRTG